MEAQNTTEQTVEAEQREVRLGGALSVVSLVAPWLGLPFVGLLYSWWNVENFGIAALITGVIISVLAWIASVGIAFNLLEKARTAANANLRRSAIAILVISVFNLLQICVLAGAINAIANLDD
jgi:hypothetical protein